MAVDDSSISVEWTDPNVALSCPADPNINIYRDGVSVHNLTSPGSASHVDSSLDPGTVYEYQVSAMKGSDESTLSSVFVLCTLPAALTTPDVTCAPDMDVVVNSKLHIDSNESLYNYDIQITGDFTQSVTKLDLSEYSMGTFEPGVQKSIDVVVTVLFDCPKISGSVVLRSVSNPTVSLDCYTLPGEVTIRKESSSTEQITISWAHQGASDGYQIKITPFVNSNTGGGSEVFNVSASNTTYQFSGLDGKSTYTIEITNFYQGYASPVASIEYDSSNTKELIGLPFVTGVVVLVVVAVVGLAVIGGVVFGVKVLITKFVLAQSGNAVQPNNPDFSPDIEVDYSINKTYDLRAEFIAAQLAKAAPAE